MRWIQKAVHISGSGNFTVTNISGASYTWVVSGTLSIVSGQGTSIVNFNRNEMSVISELW
ncbi:hypothetical protein [Dyadobacter chenwenxiniae]|uniref:hypothetical protein n=1 Tax=Dyadobacter chenwenxiniae TaxID=2906456 RepID=UPI0035B6779A